MNPLSDQSESVVPVEPTHKMVTEGDRALSLWADESLREEIDGRRMAALVWKAMLNANEEGT